VRARLERLWPRLERGAPWLAALTALAALAAALHWGSYAVGGSDSYCYVSQAGFWLDGTLRQPQAVGFNPPWPHAAESLTPTGYIPSPTVPGGIAPMCPAGLALTMAPAWALGGPLAVFLVVPVLGAIAVWLTFVLGRSLDRPTTGLAAAVLVAASPIVLFQSFQPMSDVAVMAWWLAALVLASRPGSARAFGAGLAASAAILTRPNLAPLALVMAAFIALRPRSELDGGRRMAGPAAFVIGVAPGVALVALIQLSLYGSPLNSGYGPLDQLFSWSHLLPNLQRYPRWLVASHTPVICLALAAPLVLGARASRRADAERWRHAAWLAWLCLAFVGAVFAAYVTYSVFDDWWYVRFLLPAIPLILALSMTVLVGIVSRLPAGLRAPAGIACVAGLAVSFVVIADSRGVFGFREFERRFRDAGQFVAARLPDRAVVLTIWESGSVRYYGKRLTIVPDQIEPAWLDRVVSFLEEQGRPPYLLFEASEEPAFRARFQTASRYGALDWPPMAQIGRTVRIFNPADRARYLAGERIETERVWPERRDRRRPGAGSAR
jgi:hypothetical protein